MKADYEAEMQKIVARFRAGSSIADLAHLYMRDRLDIEAILRAEAKRIHERFEAARLEEDE